MHLNRTQRRHPRALLADPSKAYLAEPVALSAMPTDAGGAWNVLAYEAELLGYRLANGKPATITRAGLEACVANFARYPKVPIVIEHADTRDGPTEWAEPHGWITEVRLGTMERALPDGGKRTVATLEGRLALDENTRAKVNGTPPTWPFGSVTIFPETDPETGKDLGMALWSFSLTAHPRLTDVPKLAAGRALEAGCWYGELEDREDVLTMLRTVFDLPALATEADTLAALDKLEALAAPGADTGGVDVDDLVGRLRDALLLPALSSTAEVLAALRRALATLPTETETLGASAPSHTESTMKFLELAKKYGLATASEEDAQAAVLALADDGSATRSALSLPVGTPLAPKLAEVVTAAAELSRVSPELTELRAARDARAEADRTARVAAVCLAKGWGDEAKPALLAFAKSDPAAFEAAYPAPTTAELAQRAQDGARLERVVPPAKTEAGKPVEPEAKPSTDKDLAALRAVYARAGIALSIPEALDLLQRGETPARAAAELGVTAA